MTERDIRRQITRLTVKRARIDRLLVHYKGKLARKRSVEQQAEKDWRYKRWL